MYSLIGKLLGEDGTCYSMKSNLHYWYLDCKQVLAQKSVTGKNAKQVSDCERECKWRMVKSWAMSSMGVGKWVKGDGRSKRYMWLCMSCWLLTFVVFFAFFPMEFWTIERLLTVYPLLEDMYLILQFKSQSWEWLGELCYVIYTTGHFGNFKNTPVIR